MADLEGILASLELTPAGSGRFSAGNADSGPGTIFGGQLLAQTIMAALAGQDDKRVLTAQCVFARAGRLDAPVEIAVEPVHSGRSMASSTVTISQGERICTRSTVLLTAEEPDLIRHLAAAPPVPDPSACAAVGHLDGWDIRIVGDVDISDPDLVGPASLNVWSRFADAPGERGVAEALLAFASDGFLIATAMRPHEGIGQSQAHATLATGVLSHTITFHEPFAANGWLMMCQESPHAGRGRSYGRAEVFDAEGTLVASFVQDAMIRSMS